MHPALHRRICVVRTFCVDISFAYAFQLVFTRCVILAFVFFSRRRLRVRRRFSLSHIRFSSPSSNIPLFFCGLRLSLARFLSFVSSVSRRNAQLHLPPQFLFSYTLPFAPVYFFHCLSLLHCVFLCAASRVLPFPPFLFPAAWRRSCSFSLPITKCVTDQPDMSLKHSSSSSHFATSNSR